MIKYNDSIQKAASFVLKKAGFKEISSPVHDDETTPGKEIAILGFHRMASSLLSEVLGSEENDSSLKDKIVVVDFNPEIHESLQSVGVKVVYGDISHLDTLYHAGIHDVKIVVSTIPDTILVGTDNLKIIRHMRDVCPNAKIIVTAESIERALKMYAEGADYVFIPRVLAADRLMSVIDGILSDSKKMKTEISEEIELLKCRSEIIR
jgi:Trk K+ transport system NAD-binding subunit